MRIVTRRSHGPRPRHRTVTGGYATAAAARGAAAFPRVLLLAPIFIALVLPHWKGDLEQRSSLEESTPLGSTAQHSPDRRSAEEYAADPAYNPYGLSLDECERAELEALIERNEEHTRRATATMLGFAAEWARIRIGMGHCERIREPSPAPGPGPAWNSTDPGAQTSRSAPTRGAIIYERTADGLYLVVIHPGEYAPFDVAFEDRQSVMEQNTERLMTFFSTLSPNK